jgi:transcriptional regulator with XRE-family HTH domain
MKLAVIAKLRHGAMIKFREEMGYSQSEAAAAAGLSSKLWCEMECFKFSGIGLQSIRKVADLLGMSPDELVPEELRSLTLGPGAALTRVAFRDVEPNRLASMAKAQLSYDDVDRKDLIEQNLAKLTFREREILKLRYGLCGEEAHTFSELGRIFKVSAERIRGVQLKAERNMQEHLMRSLESSDMPPGAL